MVSSNRAATICPVTLWNFFVPIPTLSRFAQPRGPGLRACRGSSTLPRSCRLRARGRPRGSRRQRRRGLPARGAPLASCPARARESALVSRRARASPRCDRRPPRLQRRRHRRHRRRRRRRRRRFHRTAHREPRRSTRRASHLFSQRRRWRRRRRRRRRRATAATSLACAAAAVAAAAAAAAAAAPATGAASSTTAAGEASERDAQVAYACNFNLPGPRQPRRGSRSSRLRVGWRCRSRRGGEAREAQAITARAAGAVGRTTFEVLCKHQTFAQRTLAPRVSPDTCLSLKRSTSLLCHSLRNRM